MRGHQGAQLLHRLELEGAYQDTNLVFPKPLGQPWDPVGFSRGFKSLCKRAGLQGVNLHSLRHFHASLLIQKGESPVLVSKRLGHANVSITMNTYAHLLKGYQKEAAATFAKAMKEGQ